MKTSLHSSTRRKYDFLLSFSLLLLCLLSCKKDGTISNNEVKGEAKVRVINATQNTDPVNFYVGNFKINSSLLAFGEVTDYTKISSGVKISKVEANGVEEAVNSITFVPTISYTSFYIEDRSEIGSLITLEDDLSVTENGKARIRFVNTSPFFTNGINVNLTGAILLVNALGFGQTSGYFSVNPDADLRISVLGTGSVKLVPSATIEAGKIYTFWFSGVSNSNLTINKITYN